MNRLIFYGDKLRLARFLKGYTQQQLGDAITASRQFVHQMENGLKRPADDVLNVLCEVLDVRRNFFYSPLVNDVKSEQCHFRKRKTTPINLSNRVLAYGTIFEKLIDFIHEYIELPTINFPNIPHNAEQYSNNEIELAVEACKKEWKLGIDTPISNITRVLENVGIVITEFQGVSEKVDALSFNRKYPILIRNGEKDSSCSIRFDLAHECGHLVLHNGIETGDKQTESEADKFASAFLFPRVAFIKEFPDFKGRNLNWDVIYTLKIRWGMSVRALLYRAYHLNLITAQQYRSANVRLNKTKQIKSEKLDEKVLKEEPELLLNALNIINHDIGISFDQVSKSLDISSNMLSIMTGIPYELNSYNNRLKI